MALSFDQVVYDTSGFLEKNRDLLHIDSIQLLASCTCHLPQIFASKILMHSEKTIGNVYRSSGADNQKLSVATKFKVKTFWLYCSSFSDTIIFKLKIKAGKDSLVFVNRNYIHNQKKFGMKNSHGLYIFCPFLKLSKFVQLIRYCSVTSAWWMGKSFSNCILFLLHTLCCMLITLNGVDHPCECS